MNAPTQTPSKPRGPQGPRLKAATPRQRALAAAILDVLGGGRTPLQAAESLGVSLPRYYALEARGLDGLVDACAERVRGRVRQPGREMEALRKEVERLRRELDRKQALIRACQRTVGLAAPTKPPASRKRKRRPTVRALRAAAVLRSEPAASAVASTNPE